MRPRVLALAILFFRSAITIYTGLICMKLSLSKILAGFLIASILFFAIFSMAIYTQFSESIRVQGKKYTKDALNTMASQLTEQIEDILRDMRYLSSEQVFMEFQDMQPAKRYQVKDSLITILNSFTSFKASVIGMKFHASGKSGLYSPKNFSPISEATIFLAYEDIIQKYALDQYIPGEIVTEIYEYDGRNVFGIIMPVFHSKLLRTADTYRGALLALCDFSTFEDLLPPGSVPCYITDESARILLRNADAASIGASADEIVVDVAFHDLQLKACAFYSEEYAGDYMLMLQRVCLSVIVLLILVQGSLLIALRIKITKPIEDIARQTQRVSSGAISIKNNDASRNELELLTRGINDMVSRVEQLSRKAANAHSKYLRERVMFLQTQINPHFLFNNLECIRGMASMQRTDSILTITSSIAAIYRYCLGNEPYVSVAEEVECLRQYMKILALRYDGRFSMHMDLEAEALQKKMPRMILQPLAENAIQHGFLHAKRRNGNIFLRACVEKNALLLVLEDDGAGMPADQIARLNAQQPMEDVLRPHIGIANIQNRIEMICVANSCVRFEARETSGVRVILRIQVPETYEMIGEEKT